MTGSNSLRGFTLLELLLVLGILATVAALSFPRVHSWADGARDEETLFQLVSTVTTARAQAVEDRALLELLATPNSELVARQGRVLGMPPDLFLHQVQEPNAALSGPRVLLSLEDGYRIRMDPPEVRFFPNGTATPGRIMLWREDQALGGVQIAGSGIISTTPPEGPL